VSLLGDQAEIERLVQYMTRCSFSLARLVKVTDTGQVVYKAEKASCRSFSDPGADDMQAGAKRNNQILPPLDFLAEFTQHITAKGAYLIRYYGWYSNKIREMRKQTSESSPVADTSSEASDRCSPSWLMLIKRACEVHLLSCAECGGLYRTVPGGQERQVAGHTAGAKGRRTIHLLD